MTEADHPLHWATRRRIHQPNFFFPHLESEVLANCPACYIDSPLQVEVGRKMPAPSASANSRKVR
jgi:hypothetical protein